MQNLALFIIQHIHLDVGQKKKCREKTEEEWVDKYKKVQIRNNEFAIWVNMDKQTFDDLYCKIYYHRFDHKPILSKEVHLLKRICKYKETMNKAKQT